MSKQDREKWNKRYAENSYHKNNSVKLVVEWLPKLPVNRALDVACGVANNRSRSRFIKCVNLNKNNEINLRYRKNNHANF